LRCWGGWCNDGGRGGGLDRSVVVRGGSGIAPSLALAVSIIYGLPDGQRSPVVGVEY
jgi:hypothetical protein